MKMEAENGMMPPETKECLEDQKLEEVENDSPQSRGRGAWPVSPLISDFWLQDCERIHFWRE